VTPLDPAPCVTVAERLRRDGLAKLLFQIFIAARGAQEGFQIDFLVRKQTGL